MKSAPGGPGSGSQANGGAQPGSSAFQAEFLRSVTRRRSAPLRRGFPRRSLIARRSDPLRRSLSTWLLPIRRCACRRSETIRRSQPVRRSRLRRSLDCRGRIPGCSMVSSLLRDQSPARYRPSSCGPGDRSAGSHSARERNSHTPAVTAANPNTIKANRLRIGVTFRQWWRERAGPPRALAVQLVRDRR